MIVNFNIFKINEITLLHAYFSGGIYMSKKLSILKTSQEQNTVISGERNIMKIMNAVSTELAPNLNTGTIFDLMTGQFQLGKNGYYCNGGLNFTTGITGSNSCFKSTCIQSFVTRILNIYPDSTLNYYETELHLKDLNRFDQVKGSHTSVKDRIILHSATEYDLIQQNEFIKNLIETKMKHEKDLTIETPFLSERTGQPLRMMIPTIIVIDSFSNASSIVEQDLYDSTALGDSKQNIIYMRDGLIKTSFLRNILPKAAKASVYLVFVVHKGKKTDIGQNAFIPQPKDYQFMKQDEKLKNVGANFQYLMMTLINAASIKTLVDSEKDCLYPSESDVSKELSEVTYTVVKCKGNTSGTSIPFIMSQYQGFLDSITNFHYLKLLKDYGIQGKGKYNLKLYPTLSFTRKDIRNHLKNNYEFERALDLTAQLAYIQNNWSQYNCSVDISIPIDIFIEKLCTVKNITISDILNSRSYWSYSTSNEIRPYLSIFDILALFKENL
jgi:hypothetical protein